MEGNVADGLGYMLSTFVMLANGKLRLLLNLRSRITRNKRIKGVYFASECSHVSRFVREGCWFAVDDQCSLVLRYFVSQDE